MKKKRIITFLITLILMITNESITFAANTIGERTVESNRHKIQIKDIQTGAGTALFLESMKLNASTEEELIAIEKTTGQTWIYGLNQVLSESSLLEMKSIGQAIPCLQGKSECLSLNSNGNWLTALKSKSSPQLAILGLTHIGNSIYISLAFSPSEKHLANIYIIESTIDRDRVISARTVIYKSREQFSRNNWHFLGGAITSDFLDNILMAVADYRLDANGLPLPEYPDWATKRDSGIFGKVIKINIKNKRVTVVARGFRNPQGLLYEQDTKKIILTEHGPKGGDEINDIATGRDYGYPFVTFGKPYFSNVPSKDWDASPNNPGYKTGTCEGFECPIFSWVPSIAPTQVIKVTGSEKHKDWNGNYLLATLKDEAIHRLIIKGNRMLIDERIFVGDRIRDLVQLGKNTFVYSTDDGFIHVVS
jgi:hypothetical protein